MNRIEFIATIAIVLFIVFALGWFSNWVMGRFMRVSETDIAELDAMGHALHQAEETRDQALQRLQQRETELMSQLHNRMLNAVPLWKLCGMRASKPKSYGLN